MGNGHKPTGHKPPRTEAPWQKPPGQNPPRTKAPPPDRSPPSPLSACTEQTNVVTTLFIIFAVVSAMPRQSFVSVRQLRRNFDDGGPSAEGHPRWYNQPGSNPSFSVAICLAQWSARSHAARNAERYCRNHSLDGATIFQTIQIN